MPPGDDRAAPGKVEALIVWKQRRWLPTAAVAALWLPALLPVIAGAGGWLDPVVGKRGVCFWRSQKEKWD